MAKERSHRTNSSGAFARQAAAAGAAERKLTATVLALETPGQISDDDASTVLDDAWAPWLAALKGLAPARPTTIADLAEKTRLTAHAIHHIFGPPAGSDLAKTPHGQLALRLTQALASDAQAVAATTQQSASAARRARDMRAKPSTTRRKATDLKQMAATRWPAMEMDDPPSWETWRQRAHGDLVLVRMLVLFLRQDSEASFRRSCELGTDAEHWAALLDMQGCLFDAALRWRQLADLFETGSARLLCLMQRAQQQRPDFQAAMDRGAAMDNAAAATGEGQP